MRGDREREVELRVRMAAELPEGLVAHIDRVVELAGVLARRHGLDAARARLMAQGHDVLRHLPPDELLRRAGECGLELDAADRDEPVILHGPLGALELARRFSIDDAEVLFAIHWHTTGHPDYTPEAWAMFVADKVEPHKLEGWPALAAVRETADASLEQAACEYLDLRLQDGIAAGYTVHPMALTARNHLLRTRRQPR